MTFVDFIPSLTLWAAFFTTVMVVIEKNLKTPYKIGQMEDKRQQRSVKWGYVSNICSIAHAIASFLWANYLINTYGIRYTATNLDSENALMAFSAGYFFVDTTFGLFYGYNDFIMTCHHLEVFSLLIYALIKGRYASPNVSALWVSEASNPLILLRKNLDCHRNTENISTIVGVIFCAVFLYTRTYLMGGLVAPLQESETSMFMKLSGGLICRLKRVHLALLVLCRH